jgi:CheY-like chemotaxis protein
MQTTNNTQTTNTDKKKILVVDDEHDLTFLVKLSLERTGNYEVREVNRALEAVDAAKEFRPDLVLLDVMMPDLDGGDVASAIEEEPTLKGTPIVFLTAMVLQEEVGGRGLIGGRPFLAKPVSMEDLIESVEDHVRA